MARIIQRLIFIILLIGGLTWFWDNFRSSTFEVVTVQSISKNEMKVINLGGRERTISVPVNMTGVIEINKYYTVSYDKRVLDKYRLRKISKSPMNRE